MSKLVSTTPAKAMTLELLRTKTRAALALLPTGTEDLVSFTYISFDGEETEIGKDHLFDDARCLPGRYVVEISGGSRFEGRLLDPSVTATGMETTPNEAMGKLLTSVLLTANNSVENSGRREKEALQQLDETRKERDQLHHSLMVALARNAHLENGGGGDKGLNELRDVFLLLLQEWAGGGGQWTPDKVRHVVRLVALIRRSDSLRIALTQEGAGDIVKALVAS